MPVDVSVVVPTFRRPALLTEAVESALGQAGVAVEVFVVDDSPEGSALQAAAALRDPRVTYMKMDRPSGGKPALVRNAGGKLARGRFVHFLDDDDRVADGAYASLAAALHANPRAGVAFGRVEPFGDDRDYLLSNRRLFAESSRRAHLASQLRSRRVLLASMLFCNPCLTCSACLVRREVMEAMGGFRESVAPFEDADFFIRAIRRFGHAFVERTVLHYRTGQPSLMRNLAGGRGAAAYRDIYARYAAENGAAELFGLKLLAKTVLRRV